MFIRFPSALRLPSWIIGAALCLLVTTASAAEQGSVAKQFGLNVNGRDISDCWLNCHMYTTDILPAPWMSDGGNGPYNLKNNCKYTPYQEAMAKCLVQQCKSSWDVQYAVEFGTVICKKAGINMVIPIDPTYTATAGGYYATATLKAQQPVLASSAQRRVFLGRTMALAVAGGLGAGMVALLGTW